MDRLTAVVSLYVAENRATRVNPAGAECRSGQASRPAKCTAPAGVTFGNSAGWPRLVIGVLPRCAVKIKATGNNDGADTTGLEWRSVCGCLVAAYFVAKIFLGGVRSTPCANCRHVVFIVALSCLAAYWMLRVMIADWSSVNLFGWHGLQQPYCY